MFWVLTLDWTKTSSLNWSNQSLSLLDSAINRESIEETWERAVAAMVTNRRVVFRAVIVSFNAFLSEEPEQTVLSSREQSSLDLLTDAAMNNGAET